MSEGPSGSQQIEQALVSEAHDTVNTLLVILDKKKADLTSLLTYAYGPQANEWEYTQAVNELDLALDLLTNYNQCAGYYLQNTDATQQAIQSLMRNLKLRSGSFARGSWSLSSN
jgi:hypothetical protein